VVLQWSCSGRCVAAAEERLAKADFSVVSVVSVVRSLAPFAVS